MQIRVTSIAFRTRPNVNLHAIVAGCIGAINPSLTASYQQSDGYTTNTDGSRTPSYATPVAVFVQKQPMSYQDLALISGLNINGEKCCFYVNGNWQGVARPTSQGGDLITLQDSGQTWLVIMLLENWSEMDGWSKVAAVLQS